MKQVVILALAVMIGIWAYRKIQASKLKKTGVSTTGDQFEGPDVDPKTGAYLGPGVSSGTVEFPAQGN
jgi:hypothetical protein